MYRNLNCAALGISGRQSEMVELVLNNGFSGLDVDADEMIRRATKHGVADATSYVRSAKIKVNGWRLPCDLGAADAAFSQQFAQLEKTAATAEEIGFRIAEAVIQPASDLAPYHENFERHRQRLGQVGGLLAKHGIRVAVGLLAAPEHRKGRQFPFIFQAEELLTLLKTVGSPAVGLLLDTWNWRLGGGTIQQIGDLRGDQIVCIRIADIPADADLATITEDQRLLPSDETLPSYEDLCKTLFSKDFSGPVTLQPHPSRIETKGREPRVQAAAQVLAKMFAAVTVG